ncbi:MAG: hypothetical protein ABIH89_08755 [Elusimicrobiota bacterium]
MKNSNKRQILSILTVLVILSFTSLGTFQIQKNITGAVSLLKTALNYPSIAVMEVNGCVKGAATGSVQETSNRAGDSNDKDSRKIFNFLFLIMGGALFASKESMFLVFLIGILAAVSVCLKSFTDYLKRRCRPPDDDFQYYSRWRLKFITPVDKCIQNLADKYDINPILMYGRASNARVINPHFV